MKIVIPMLGHGSKFIQAGIRTPKLLLNVKGKPIFVWAIESLPFINFEKQGIFIVLKEHVDSHQIDKRIKTIIGEKTDVIVVDNVPNGAAKTVLLVKDKINTNEELIVYNSDQFFVSNLHLFLKKNRDTIDGAILFFNATHPRWSFVETDSKNNVRRVAEKEVISNKATVGVYYFRRGSDFVQGAEAMIAKNLMINGEFYVCPVYNELLEKGKKIKALPVKEMWSLGTPEDVAYFEKYFKKFK